MFVEPLPMAERVPFEGPMPRLHNLRHLRALQCVGALGSVNRAAAEMNLSQPAVTQAVARIELLIAPELFVRHPTGMYPTDAGRMLLPRIDRLFEELDGALAVVLRPGRSGPSADVLMKAVQLDTLAALLTASGQAEAAVALAITQTAFRRNINALEARLDTILAFRDGTELRLTHAGETLARAAKLGQREIELAQEEIASASGRLRGRLSVGALPLARTYIVPKALIRLGRPQPRHSSPACRRQL